MKMGENLTGSLIQREKLFYVKVAAQKECTGALSRAWGAPCEHWEG